MNGKFILCQSCRGVLISVEKDSVVCEWCMQILEAELKKMTPE